MARVVISDEAENDLTEIGEYISRHDPIAAENLIDRIHSACRTIAAESQAGELREGYGIPGCRSFTVGNYVIFFSHIDDGIEIVRVIHGSRDLRDFQEW